MNEEVSTSQYLVISRGQWDQDASPEKIQKAIDDFYIWLGRLVEEGRMKPGQRLAASYEGTDKKGEPTCASVKSLSAWKAV